ncbi:MAG: class I SAM-dependent methyltransferase [Gemmataceae bacterium]
MNSDHVLAEVAAFYHARLVAPGPAAREAACASPEARALRLEMLCRVGDLAGIVGDYGCGAGTLLPLLRARGFSGEYRGYDMVPSVIIAARSRHAADAQARFSSDESVLTGVDYVLANGIFNVKLATPTPDWEASIRVTLDRLASLARRGFAFNLLSVTGQRRPDLYHAEPRRFLDFCQRRYSREATLVAGYGLDEFTILVRR